MEEGEVQISDCHNYFISWALIRLTTNQVLDCQGLEQFARLLITPGLLPFLLNFQCLLTPLENTGFNLILYLPKVNYSERFYWFTLGARDFSSAVSGFCQVFIVTRAKSFSREKKFFWRLRRS